MYHEAFQKIHKDDNHEPVVLELQYEIISTLQLSFLPYLTYQGGIRAQIEAVKIHADFRGHRLGETLFNWATKKLKRKKSSCIAAYYRQKATRSLTIL